MWPFIKKKNDIVSISLNPKYMTCCWLNESGSGKNWGKQVREKQEIAINAYEETEFNSLEFENAIIFNPTKIGFAINNFIKKSELFTNKIKNPIISIAISGSNVFEKIVTLQTSSPTEQDLLEHIQAGDIDSFGNIGSIKNIKFNYTYLCPAISEGHNIGFNFYICGITQAQLFQYRLLTLKTGGNLALVTTELAALIELYKYTKGDKFSQSQLAIDLTKNGYNIQSLFTPEVINKISKINYSQENYSHANYSQENYSHTKNNLNINLANESQCLATSLGLFLLGDKIWKK